MTWSRLQNLVSGLLAGDTVLPKDVDLRLALLEYALEEVASNTEALKLYQSNDSTREKVRRSVYDSGQFVARATLPTSNEDEIDIDQGLTFAIARYMASFISKEKFAMHEAKAKEIINRYNAKVYSYRDEVDEK